VVKYSDYTAEKVRTLYPTESDLRKQWIAREKRDVVYETLRERGIDCEELARQTHQEDADTFDLLCHVAFNAPLRTRRERAERVRKDRQDLFAKHGPDARGILEALLVKYADHGLTEFRIPDVLKVPPISDHGNITEIIGYFGGADALRDAVNELQEALYAA
jgi:type I restriction enzyme R subunit